MRLLKFISMILILAIPLSCARKRTEHYLKTKGQKARSTSVATNASKTERKHKKKAVVKSKSKTINTPVVSDGKGNKLSSREIYQKYNSAVFMIVTTDGVKYWQGSGFFINDSGLAVSNYHVFEGTIIGYESIKLVGSKKRYQVKEVISKSSEYDYILFRVDCVDNNYIPVSAKRPEIGDIVYAIGSPRGFENTFSSGMVSQWRKKYLMQTNVMIDHGSSGGPLINEFGEVVGITSGTLYEGSQANLNYVWSITAVKELFE